MDHRKQAQVIPIRPGPAPSSSSTVVYRSTEFYDIRRRMIQSLPEHSPPEPSVA